MHFTAKIRGTIVEDARTIRLDSGRLGVIFLLETYRMVRHGGTQRRQYTEHTVIGIGGRIMQNLDYLAKGADVAADGTLEEIFYRSPQGHRRKVYAICLTRYSIFSTPTRFKNEPERKIPAYAGQPNLTQGKP